MVLDADTKVVLLLAAGMFLWALALGVWKYRQIVVSRTHRAHLYVDIAHRAALMYSFALLLVATFVQFSDFSTAVNLVGACAPAFYFFAAVGSYAWHGWRADTDNQFREPVRGTHAFMVSLIVGEIGGFLLLVAGFLDGQVF